MSYYVGIDIAKNKHDCCIMTGDGLIVRNTFTFPNDEKGFEQFKVALDQLNKSQDIKIGLEATGHYGRNLKLFLIENGYSFTELNPYLVSKFTKSLTLRRTKTDKIDSMMISKYLMAEASKPSSILPCDIQELKKLVREYDKLVRKRSDEIVIITNALDEIFPEFKKFFNNKLGTVALEILEKYPSTDLIKKLTPKQIQKLHNLSRNISVNKFTQLKELALNSIGHHSHSDEIIIKTSINSIKVINDNIKIIREEIQKIMKQINSPICSIPGIGLISAAAIVAEYGDVKRFTNAGKMLAYAGLECSKYQSGQTDFKGRMVKHGSSHLRYVLMNVAISVKNHCPVFAEYFYKKYKTEGKHYRVALNHVVRKLLRVIYKLMVSNESYNLDLSA